MEKPGFWPPGGPAWLRPLRPGGGPRGLAAAPNLGIRHCAQPHFGIRPQILGSDIVFNHILESDPKGPTWTHGAPRAPCPQFFFVGPFGAPRGPTRGTGGLRGNPRSPQRPRRHFPENPDFGPDPGFWPRPLKLAPEPSELAPAPSELAPEPSELATEPSGWATDPSGVATEPSGLATDPSGVATEPQDWPRTPH